MADSINLGSVYATLELDTKNFESSFRDVQSSLSNIESKFGNFGESISKIFDKLKSTYIKGAKQVAIYGDVVAVSLLVLADKAAFSASKIDELTLSLHAIAKANNVSAEEADNAVTSIRDQNISYLDALKVTQNFIAANIKMSDAVKLATAAKDLAIGTDYGSSDALSTLTEAIVTNQTQTLSQFGIITTQTQAFGDYADSIGKSADDLTGAEKQQALLNVVLKAGTKRVGAYEAAQKSAGKQWRSFTTRILPDFIAQLGKAFEPSLAILVEKITNKFKDMATWIKNNQATIDEWGQKLSVQVGKGIDIFDKLVKFIVNNKGLVIDAIEAIGLAMVVAFLVAQAPMLLYMTATTAIIWLIKKLLPYIQIIKDKSSEVWKSVSDFVIGAKDTIITSFTEIIKKIQEFIDGVGATIKQFWKDHKKAIEDVASVLGVIFGPALIKAGIQAAITAAKMAYDFVISAGEAIAAWLLAFGEMIAQAIVTAVTNSIQAIKSGAIWVAQAILAGGAWLVQFAIMSAEAIAHTVVSLAQSAIAGWAWIIQAGLVAGAWLVAFLSMAAEALVTVATMAAGAVAVGIAWLIALWPILLVIAAIALIAFGVYEVIKNWDTIKTFFSKIWSNVLGGFNSFWEDVKGFGEKIGNFFSGLAKTSLEWGKNLIGGLIDGIKDKVDKMGEVLKGVANKIKGFLGFGSPTKEGPGRFADDWMPNLFNMMIGQIKDFQPAFAKAFAGMSGSIDMNAYAQGVESNQTPFIVNQTNTINRPTDTLAAARELGFELRRR